MEARLDLRCVDEQLIASRDVRRVNEPRGHAFECRKVMRDDDVPPGSSLAGKILLEGRGLAVTVRRSMPVAVRIDRFRAAALALAERDAHAVHALHCHADVAFFGKAVQLQTDVT